MPIRNSTGPEVVEKNWKRPWEIAFFFPEIINEICCVDAYKNILSTFTVHAILLKI